MPQDFSIMTKTKAKESYLLSDRELKQLCCIQWGDSKKPLESVVLISRKQAETLVGRTRH
jgi:hypothetical protein